MSLQEIGLIKKLAIALIFVGLVLLLGHVLELYLPGLEVRIQAMGAFAPQSGVSYPLLALGLVIFLAVLIYVAKIAGKTVKRLGYKG